MKKKRISLIAVNDNTAPKLRQTNSALGWVFLVILLMAGIFFAFSSESAEGDEWEVVSGPASVKSFSSDAFDEESPPASKPLASAKPKPYAAPKPKPAGVPKFQRTQYNKQGRR